jgi:hypothetical protein
VGVKIMSQQRYAAGENEKLRRPAELIVVRPILTTGEGEQVAPFNFVMVDTPSGWRFIPFGG